MTMKQRLKLIEDVKAMKREGKSVSEIAKEVGKSKGTIYKWLDAKPVRMRRNPTKAASTRKAGWMSDLQKILALDISDSVKKAAIREIVA